MYGNKTIVNFAGGELSPKMRGRSDLQVYQNGCRKIENFIIETQGGLTFRPGTVYVGKSRANNHAVLRPFSFSEDQAYGLEFTQNAIRFIRDNGFVQMDTVGIADITTANPAVVTVNSSDYSIANYYNYNAANGLIGFPYASAIILAIVISFTADPGLDSGQVMLISGEARTQLTWLNGLYVKLKKIGTNKYALLDPYSGDYLWYRWGAAVAGYSSITGVGSVFSQIAEGSIVTISGVVGLSGVNDTEFIVSDVSGKTLQLKNAITGDYLDTSSSGTYSSGGDIDGTYQIYTPYEEADLRDLQLAQNMDTMYITHHSYEPRKLIREDHNKWDFKVFKRTNDPFAATISAVTKANPCLVTTSEDHGLISGDHIVIRYVTGMSQLNNIEYIVEVISSTTFTLKDTAGTAINSSSYSTYVDGGQAVVIKDLPSAVGFNNGRLVYGGSIYRPMTLWASRLADDDGVERFDDFTAGSDADHAVVLNITAMQGKMDKVRWIGSTTKYMLVGTLSGLYKVSGNTDSEPLAPDSYSSHPIDTTYGCSTSMPEFHGSTTIYIQRDGQSVRSFEYDLIADGYISVDRNLVADHIAGSGSGFLQTAFQTGSPDILWCVKYDGQVAAMTFKSREDISGWSRIVIGLANGKVESICNIPDSSGKSQIWISVEVTIDEQIQHYIAYFSELIKFPDYEDYYTGDESSDLTTYQNACLYLIKTCTYTDLTLAYSQYTNDKDTGITMTLENKIGDIIWLKSSSSYFSAAYEGMKVYEYGGSGEITLTSYNLPNRMIAEITSPFTAHTFENISDVLDSGEWYTKISSLSGLDHLEGLSVTVFADGTLIADGGISGLFESEITVSEGSINLGDEYVEAVVGLGYTGYFETQNLDAVSQTGSGVSKQRNINNIALRYLNSVGGSVGASLYKMKRMLELSDPINVVSGIYRSNIYDKWQYAEKDKTVFVKQDIPFPCQIQAMDIYGEASDT